MVVCEAKLWYIYSTTNKTPQLGASHAYPTRHPRKTQKRICIVTKRKRAGHLVRLYDRCDPRAVYFIQNIQYPTMPKLAFRVFRDTQEKILHLHGISQDSMETVMANALEDGSGSIDGQSIAIGAG